MLQQILLQHGEDLSLEEITEYFQMNFYDVLKLLCNKAHAQADELKQTDELQFTQVYLGLCNQTLDKINKYIQDFYQYLVPYSKELHTKAVTGHNCANCKGVCDMGHNALLMQMREGHRELQTLLHELQMNALPLYSNLEYPAVYKMLRNKMQLINMKLRELIYMEEAVLIPKLLESQKKINAHHH